jgi:hypothetical protein
MLFDVTELFKESFEVMEAALASKNIKVYLFINFNPSIIGLNSGDILRRYSLDKLRSQTC